MRDQCSRPNVYTVKRSAKGRSLSVFMCSDFQDLVGQLRVAPVWRASFTPTVVDKKRFTVTVLSNPRVYTKNTPNTIVLTQRLDAQCWHSPYNVCTGVLITCALSLTFPVYTRRDKPTRPERCVVLTD